MNDADIHHEICMKAEKVITVLQKASGSEPIIAVAIAALASASIATACGISKAAFLEAAEIAWKQCQSLKH